jgi:hypothetical protein
VVIAVPFVWVVQMAVHQVIDVVPVRNLRMAARGTVRVRLVVCPTGVLRRAPIRILPVHRDAVLVPVIIVCVVEVTIVEIVRVPLVIDSGVPTTRSMRMLVVVVCVVRQDSPLLG